MSYEQMTSFQPSKSGNSVSQIIQDLKSLSSGVSASGGFSAAYPSVSFASTGVSAAGVGGVSGVSGGVSAAPEVCGVSTTAATSGAAAAGVSSYEYTAAAPTSYEYKATTEAVSAPAVISAQAPLSATLSAAPTESYEVTSQIAQNLLAANAPIEVKETEVVTVAGQSGLLVNKEEIVNWRGVIPLTEYPINEDPNPEIIRKKSEQTLTYLQEVAIRYLRPPTPPPPGDIIIKHEKNIIAQPAPPLIIRQQPPRPETPPPLVFREAPPKPPHALGQKLVTISAKRLPPPPRKVIIERLPPLPSQPQSIMIERWLPYKERKRRVIYQKPEADVIFPKPKNVIIQWEAPSVVVQKEIRDLGVLRANPVEYVQRYGATLKQYFELPDFVKQIKAPSGLVLAAEWQPSIFDLEGDVQALSLIDLDREGLSEYKNIARQFLKTEYGLPSAISEYAYQTSAPSFVKTSSEYMYPSLSSTMNVSQQPAAVSGLSLESSQTQYQQQFMYGNKNKDSILREIFALIDVNADGILTIDEARRVLLQLNEKLGRSYGEHDAQAFIHRLDRNMDGKINYDEFKQVLISSV